MAIKPIRSVTKTITPAGSNFVLLDDGVSMGKTTLTDTVTVVASPLADSKIAALGLDTASQKAVEFFATAAQGATADSAVQPGDIGTAAAEDVGYFATAAQGATADTAVQPGDLGDLATKDKVAIADIDATGTPSSSTFLRGDGTFATPAGGGDMLASVYDPQNIANDAFARANHTGTQAISTVSGLQTALDNRVRVDAAQSLSSGEKAQGRANIAAIGYSAATPVTLTNQTEINFNGLPAGIKAVHVFFKGVSTNGSAIVKVQIGDSGGIETSGYAGTAANIISTPANTVVAVSSGFLTAGAWAAAVAIEGFMTIRRTSAAGNGWAAQTVLGRSDNAATIQVMGGTKALSAELDRVRVITDNGIDQFDAGEISLSYEL